MGKPFLLIPTWNKLFYTQSIVAYYLNNDSQVVDYFNNNNHYAYYLNNICRTTYYLNNDKFGLLILSQQR